MRTFRSDFGKEALFLCVLFMIAQQGSSQTKINPITFFNQGVSSVQKEVKKSVADVNFPWIEKYEIRTETRDFDFSKQEYTFRITPSTPKKRKAQKAIYEHLRDTPDFKAFDSYCDVSATIHTDWIMLYTATRYLEIYRNLRIVLEDKNRVYNKMMDALEFDIQDLVKLESQKSEIAIKMSMLEGRKRSIEHKYNLNNKSVFPKNIISINEIYNSIAQHTPSQLNIESNKILNNLELVEKELALEKAEQKQVFDFGQIKYQGPHDELLRERISLGVGLLIPNSGNQKLKILELQLEQEALKRRFETENIEKERQTVNEQTALIEHIENYNMMLKVVEKEREKLLDIAGRLSSNQSRTPLILLDIEERHAKTQLDLLEIKEEILVDYVKFLDRTGILCVAKSLDLILN